MLVNGAANGLSSSEHLFGSSVEGLGHGFSSLFEFFGDLANLSKGDVSSVLNMLLSLSVSYGFLESLEDER